jgi:hypothetical protein
MRGFDESLPTPSTSDRLYPQTENHKITLDISHYFFQSTCSFRLLIFE